MLRSTPSVKVSQHVIGRAPAARRGPKYHCKMGYDLRLPSLTERMLQVRVDPGGTSQLNQCLNLFQLVIQGVAHMLGSGIFVVTPSIIRSMAGPATFISYILSGIAAGFSVLCYSDLASRYLCTGSAYVYSYFSIGEFGAAVVGFFLIGEMLIQAPALTLGISQNMDMFIFNSTFLRWQEDAFPEWFLNTDVIALLIMVVYMVINMVGIKSVSYINMAVAVVSFISLGTFCCVGLAKGDIDNMSKVVNPADGRTGFAPFGISGIISGAGTAFFAFVGLESVVTLAEESINPKRDLPRATILSFIVVMILYVVTAFSIAYFIPWYEVAGTTGLIGSLKDKGLTIPQYIVTAGLIFTVFSCGLCTLTTVSRIVYSIADDGLLFPFLATVNPTTQVPIWNILVCTIIGGFTSVIYDFEILLHMVSGGTLMVFIITAIAVLILSYDLTEEVPSSPSSSEKTPLTSSSSSLGKSKFLFTVAMSLFLGTAILLTALVAYANQSTRVIIFEVCLGLPILGSLAFIKWKVPLNDDEEQLTFKSPGKPFVPGFCVVINLFLLFHLEARALVQLLVYSAIGLFIYFGYGIFHSKITLAKQKKMDGIEASMEELVASSLDLDEIKPS